MSRIGATLGRGAGAAVRSVRVGYQDVAFSIDPQVTGPAVELSRTLHESVGFVVDKGRSGLAILLDEAQMLRDEASRDGEHALSMLIVAVSALQRAEIPIALVMCGLPTLTTNLLRARTYSERMFRGEHIGSLAKEGARDAFVQPLADTLVETEPRLVEAVLESVEGYPYFIQLWGAELWDAADAVGIQSFTLSLLKEIESEIFRRLDTDFYEPRVQTLTPAEQDLLLAGAGCPYPPLKVSDIQQTSDKTPGNVNVLLGRLVEAGVIYRLRKGQYEYTAPKFHDFLRRRLAHLD
jgi:DNA-binding transcriptional ArsR family regulator